MKDRKPFKSDTYKLYKKYTSGELVVACPVEGCNMHQLDDGRWIPYKPPIKGYENIKYSICDKHYEDTV